MEQEIINLVKKNLAPEYQERFLYSFENGKRLRPLLMKLVCEKYGKDFSPLIPAASGIEILHCASLIHDDIIDRETSRRDKEPFYKNFGLKEGLLFGDLLATLSMEIFVKNSYPNGVKEAFIETAREMIEGQLMEVKGIKSREEYFRYAEKKTASLFLLAARIPFIIHSLQDGKVLEFAKEFGMAFQISNDLKKRKKEKNSILSFMNMADAEKLLREKMDYLDSLGVINANKLI